ncbi:MAG: hypothetical protein GY838_04015, partial [bacterium]|nr:hypothetical protein [bacterium]
TGLKIYFGKERADNETHVGDPGEAPARNVWDDHFMGVWHLSRDPSGGAGSVIDSTARGRHGAPAGLSMENLADGPAGRALYFNGVDEWIDLGDPAAFQVASFTLEALFRYDGALADPGRGIVSGYSGGGANQHYGLRMKLSGMPQFFYDDGSEWDSVTAAHPISNGWGYVAGVLDAGARAGIFVDGVFSAEDVTSTPTAILPTDALYIGRDGSNALHGDKHWKGWIDEVRLSDISRSDAWITATRHALFDNLVQFNSEDVTPPPAVETLTVNARGDGTSAVLDWTGFDESIPGDVNFYRIYAETSPITDLTGLTVRAEVGAGTFTHEIEGLARGTTWYFAAAAVDYAGNVLSTGAAPVSAVIEDVEAPEDPTNLTDERFTSRVVLTWNPSADAAGDLAGHRLYVDGVVNGDDLAPNATTRTVTGLTPNASCTFRLVAFDAAGNESAGASITGRTLDESPGDAVGEFGVIPALDHVAVTVLLKRRYQNPVVFAQPLSYNGGDAAIVRLLDVRDDRFLLRVQEAPDRDDSHWAETVSYLVLEAGNWSLPEGGLLKAGVLETATTVGPDVGQTFDDFDFPGSGFGVTPVVISQVQTNNDPRWVKTRMRDVGLTSVRIALEEEQGATAPHGAAETVGWLAMSPGSGTMGGVAYEAENTEAAVDENWHAGVSFSRFSGAPCFIAAVSSYFGTDNCELRYRNLTANGVELMVEEDTAFDAETDHNPEVVSLVALEGDGYIRSHDFVDAAPPVIIGSEPADGAVLARVDQIVISLYDPHGTLDDASVINSLTVTDVHGQPVAGPPAVENQDHFTFTPTSAPLAHGVYTAALTAADAAGNTSEISFTFTVDSLAPAAPVITGGYATSGLIQERPAENRANSASVTLTGAREDGASVWINDVRRADPGPGDWTVDLTLTEGDNALAIVLKDAAGNTSEPAWVDILVDSIAPVIDFAEPADGSFLPVGPAVVTVHYTEETSGLNTPNTVLALKDAGFNNVPGQWSGAGGDRLVFTPDSPLSDSTYTVIVQLADMLGNQGPVLQHVFTVDTAAPAAPVVHPPASPTHLPAITITGAKEAHARILLHGEQIVGPTPETAWQY